MVMEENNIHCKISFLGALWSKLAASLFISSSLSLYENVASAFPVRKSSGLCSYTLTLFAHIEPSSQAGLVILMKIKICCSPRETLP